MEIPVVNTGYPLLLSRAFLQQVDDLIEKNVENHTRQVALFLSRLIKGLQNLSNLDPLVDSRWGENTYQIDDIGVVVFQPVRDSVSQQSAILVERINWQLSTSFFFSEFSFLATCLFSCINAPSVHVFRVNIRAPSCCLDALSKWCSANRHPDLQFLLCCLLRRKEGRVRPFGQLSETGPHLLA